MALRGCCALRMLEVMGFFFCYVEGEMMKYKAKLFSFAYLGNLRSLNELAKQARADHIIHTGDFGFYDDTSLERIADK